MIKKRLTEPVFKTVLYLLADCEYSEAEKYVNDKHKARIDLSGLSGAYATITSYDRNGRSDRQFHFLWVRDSSQLYVINHECLHLAKGVCEELGIPFDSKNDEFIAYYQEYWAKRIWRLIAPDWIPKVKRPKQKKKKKK